MNGPTKSGDLFSFGTDLLRTQSLILSKPSQLFGAPPLPDTNLSAALIAETFTEGRKRRKPPAPVNYAIET
jgi:hypothetical protein